MNTLVIILALSAPSDWIMAESPLPINESAWIVAASPADCEDGSCLLDNLPQKPPAKPASGGTQYNTRSGLFGGRILGGRIFGGR
jgi:hypothetical protein